VIVVEVVVVVVEIEVVVVVAGAAAAVVVEVVVVVIRMETLGDRKPLLSLTHLTRPRYRYNSALSVYRNFCLVPARPDCCICHRRP